MLVDSCASAGVNQHPKIQHPTSFFMLYSPIMRGLVLLAMLLFALQPAFPQDIGAGKKLYAAHCAACHGQKGEGGRGARLTTATRASGDDSLFNVIQKGIPGTEMPAAPLKDREIRDVVVFVRGLQRDSTLQIATGSARGERIYRKSGCGKCHMIGAEGGTLGPDLSSIGRRRVPDYLRRALLDPEADIPESFGQYRWTIVIPDNFLQVRATTRDGRQITGARVNEDTFSIQVRDASGQVYSFWKEELKELHRDWGKSPMPSYKDKLTPAEIEDLVSYLSSQRGAR
jgi:cytochrome c oxidase cbb3-type subunit 3